MSSTIAPVRTRRGVRAWVVTPFAVAVLLAGTSVSPARAEGGQPFGNGFDRLTDHENGIAVKGWAIDPDTATPINIRITVDGAASTLTANDPRPDVADTHPGYGDTHGYSTVLPAGSGTHQVCVTFLNVGSGSNTNAGCRTITTSTPAPAATSTRPGPATTGAPSTSGLTVHKGDLTITEPGTVIDGWDIRGYVRVRADNVTIKRSIIRGGEAATTNRALVASWWGNRDLLVEDSTLVADHPSLLIDGLSGANFTARRLDIYGVVDGIKVIGPNVAIQGTWIHDTLYSDNDPYQSDGRTHDDSIQVEGGSNIVIRNNVLQDSHNAAIQVTQNYSVTRSLLVEDNWLSHGGCTLNVTEEPLGTSISGMVVRNNRFGLGGWGTVCPMLLPSSSPIGLSGNVWEDTGKPASPRRF